MRSVLRVTTVIELLSTVGLSLLGCASPAAPSAHAPTPVAERPEPRASKSAEPAEPAVADSEAAPAPTAASEDSAKPADEPRDGLRKASRPPLDLLTGNNVLYMFNFADSAVGTSAKEQCQTHADSPAAVRECLAKERVKIPIESVRFVKDAHDQYWWVTFNRYKGNLLKWHKIQFVPGTQDADSVRLNLTGKDKGIAPMPRVPAALKVELPNDYSIVISDPEYGAMTYDAKIGLLEPEQ